MSYAFICLLEYLILYFETVQIRVFAYWMLTRNWFVMFTKSRTSYTNYANTEIIIESIFMDFGNLQEIYRIQFNNKKFRNNRILFYFNIKPINTVNADIFISKHTVNVLHCDIFEF